MKKLWTRFKLSWVVLFGGRIQSMPEMQALLGCMPGEPHAKVIGDRGKFRLVEFRIIMPKVNMPKKKKKGHWAGGQVQ